MTLNKFYDLVSAYATVTLKDARNKKVYYTGLLKSLPDEYDNWTVIDFNMDNEGRLNFRVKAPAKRV